MDLTLQTAFSGKISVLRYGNYGLSLRKIIMKTVAYHNGAGGYAETPIRNGHTR